MLSSDRPGFPVRRGWASLAEGQSQLTGDFAHDLPDFRQPVVGEAAGHAGDRDRRQRLGAVIVDDCGNTAQAHAGFFVVDRKTLLADLVELLEQVTRPHDRLFGQARHAVMADDGADLLVGIGREHRLADARGHHRDAAADLGQRTHDLAALHPGQHDDVFVVHHGEIGGFAGEIAQLAKIGNRLRGEIAPPREARADREAADADMPFGFGTVGWTKRRLSSVASRRWTVEADRPVRTARSLRR